jgi:hypothetical protein
MLAFGLIGRFHLAYAANLSLRHSQPQLRLKTYVTPRLFSCERSRQVVSLD